MTTIIKNPKEIKKVLEIIGVDLPFEEIKLTYDKNNNKVIVEGKGGYIVNYEEIINEDHPEFYLLLNEMQYKYPIIDLLKQGQDVNTERVIFNLERTIKEIENMDEVEDEKILPIIELVYYIQTKYLDRKAEQLKKIRSQIRKMDKEPLTTEELKIYRNLRYKAIEIDVSIANIIDKIKKIGQTLSDKLGIEDNIKLKIDKYIIEFDFDVLSGVLMKVKEA